MGIRIESNVSSGLLERWLTNEIELDGFVELFQSRQLPVREWTHRAHIGVAAALVERAGRSGALTILRDAIPRYNEATGGVNSDSSGYHETLTVFWVDRVADLLERLPDSWERVSRVRAVVEAYGLLRRLDRAFYSFDVVRSNEARRHWIAPDV